MTLTGELRSHVAKKIFFMCMFLDLISVGQTNSFKTGKICILVNLKLQSHEP